MYNDTITLFNYHEATGLWHPCVISGVDLGLSQSSNASREGRNNANTFTALIRTNSKKELMTEDGPRRYLSPKEYASCIDPAGFYTFTPEQDFIYEGEWDIFDSIAESEEDEGLYQQMNDQYDGVHMIQSVEFFRLLPHFEIGGR